MIGGPPRERKACPAAKRYTRMRRTGGLRPTPQLRGAIALSFTVSRFVTIGGLHMLAGQLCEDYAIAAQPDDAAVVAVADGCSGAQANTDIGARVICHAFAHVTAGHDATREGRLRDDFDVVLEATMLQFAFTEDLADYLATLVGVVATPERATAFLCGDGAIGVRFRDGRFELRTFAWRDDAPYYFMYRLEPSVRERMIERLSADCPGAVRAQVVEFTVGDDGAPRVADRRLEAYTFAEFERGRRFDFAPQRQAIAALAVFTDGIEKVGRLAPIDVVARLLAPRDDPAITPAEHATSVLRELAEQGHIPFDDLAFACIEFDDEDESDLA